MQAKCQPPSQWTAHQPCPGAFTQAEGPVFSVEPEFGSLGPLPLILLTGMPPPILVSKHPFKQGPSRPRTVFQTTLESSSGALPRDAAGGLQGAPPSRAGLLAGATFRGAGLSYACSQPLFNNGACVCLTVTRWHSLGPRSPPGRFVVSGFVSS